MSDASLSDRLRDYAALSDAERAQTDVEAADRPDLAEAWAEARALAALTDTACQPDNLATRVVDERLNLGEPVADPKADEMRAALDRFAREAEDPAAQFTRLTGHSLYKAGTPIHRNGHTNGTAARPTAARPATNRPPERKHTRYLRRVAFALVTVLGLYGVAFTGSSLTLSERARVANIADIEDSLRPVRGASLSDRYVDAVEILESAQSSTLGLFPRIDEVRLDEAAEAFAGIAHEAPEDGFGKEAALALGRIRVLQGRDEEARVALDAVMAQGGYRAPEAARLLDYLDEQAR
ncbi:MAG: hypothetical protein AAGI52_04565 [Bacteroidota bacterium]